MWNTTITERLKVVNNEPIYIAFTVLELSKWLMYNFYYERVKRYRENASLYYKTMYSLIFDIRTKTVRVDMKQNLTCLTLQYNIPFQNKAYLGLFKDEKVMDNYELIGWSPNMCAICLNDKMVKKLMELKSVIKNELTLEGSKNCNFYSTLVYMKQSLLRPMKHVLTQKQNKLALSPYDDKRFIKRLNSFIIVLPI